MQPVSPSSDPLASIERHLIAIEHTLEHHTIVLAQLSDELAAASRRDDWHHAQFGEMIRILARDMRELRATLICSVVSDGPISTQIIQTLLRQTPEDTRDLDAEAFQQSYKHAN